MHNSGLVNRSPSRVAEYVEVDRFHFLRVPKRKGGEVRIEKKKKS